MKKFLTLIFLGLFLLSVKAQVTIGTGEEPIQGALLQLKSIDKVTNDTRNAYKGLALPRVTLSDKNQLYPMFLTNPDDPASGPNAAYQAGKTDIDKIHTGLIVYNLTEDDDKELCLGLNQWDGEKWNCFESKKGPAVFTVPDCSKIKVYGVYQNDVSLTSANYIIVPVVVDKVGSYSITIVPDPANGYYFSASGEFLSTGPTDVMIQGAGTPVNYTVAPSEGDEIKLSINGVNFDCSNKPKIKIEDSTIRPRYGMSCNSVTVSGVYRKDAQVTNSHYIKLRLNVYDGSKGASYTVKTDEIDGLSFIGSGVLGDAGSQEIMIYAQGTVYNTAPKTFTITTNSESTTLTCKATVVPVIAQKKIVEFAAAGGATYGMASGGNWGPKAMLSSPMNFGDDENSIVKYLGFSKITHVDAGATSTAMLRTYAGLGGSQPADVIVFTYAAYPLDEAAVTMLVDYVNKGGILIYMDQTSGVTHRSLLSKIFGENVSTSNMVDIAATASYVIKMNSGVNDEIMNGPFGDCRNYQWGDDLANTRGLTFIPRDAIVYAGGVNANTGLNSSTGTQVSIMKHRTKNFFWFGDSGFIASGGENWTVQTSKPFKVASYTINGVVYPKYPVTKPHGYSVVAPVGNLSIPVCNSIFFANLMAWAVKTAEEDGINSGQQ